MSILHVFYSVQTFYSSHSNQIMPVFNRYSYDPLIEKGSTRHALLDSALDAKAPLNCTLTGNHPLVQDGGYCATTSVWGKQEFPFNFGIRDNCDMLYLRTTAMVGKLLRCFRLKNRPRILRIGDLCIDQRAR